MNCVICDRLLAGGLDTYGALGLEQCWECWIENGDDPEGYGTDGVLYGLGPHQHLTDMEGNIIIGGTMFYELPEPDANGLIDVGKMPGAFYRYFRPDPECPGCGTWFRDKSAFFKYGYAIAIMAWNDKITNSE